MDGAAAAIATTTARCASRGARCEGSPDRRACDRAGAIAPIVGVGVGAAAMARARWCAATLFLDAPAFARPGDDGRTTDDGAVRTERRGAGRERDGCDDARRGAGGGVRGRDRVGEFRELGAGDASDGGDVGVLLRAIGG